MTTHWFYVLAAWSAGAALLGGLSVAAVLRQRAARAAVAALERRAPRRAGAVR